MSTEPTPTTDPALIERLSQADLAYLATPGAELSRRELRARARAVETGQLKLVDGAYQPVPTAEQPAIAAPEGTSEMLTDSDGSPLPVTSADVLGGSVSASTGMTRRQLRELAARHAAAQANAIAEAGAPTGDEPAVDDTAPVEVVASAPATPAPAEADQTELVPVVPPAPAPEEPVTPPQRVSARVTAKQLKNQPPTPQTPAERTARRPVVSPGAIRSVEHTGEFDPIRRAMQDINAAADEPAAPVAAPRRESVFEAVVPAALREEEGDTDTGATEANDWTTAIGLSPVTDDVLPEHIDQSPEPEPDPEPVEAPASGEDEDEDELQSTQAMSAVEIDHSMTEGREDPTPALALPAEEGLPDWSALTAVNEDELAAAEAQPESSTPGWLAAMQWVVIVAVAVVLGLLVWYALTKGFGNDGNGGNGALAITTWLPIPAHAGVS